VLRPNWPNATLSEREFSEFACLGRECVMLGFDDGCVRSLFHVATGTNGKGVMLSICTTSGP
jgi:hypothetical protein